MKKILLVLGFLLVVGGSVFALMPGFFPDTVRFPRIPIGSGSIGSILTKILGYTDLTNVSDGSVHNTNMLSGVSSSGYLLRQPECAGGLNVVKGVKPDGSWDCQMKSSLLAHVATVTSVGCSGTVYHPDETTSPISTGMILSSGDIIKTNTAICEPTELAFQDFSLLRLDSNTTVSLEIGANPATNETLANIILSNGSLWGRILTETGVYEFRNGDVVAGVRGTSIAMIQTGTTTFLTPLSGSATGWTIGTTTSSPQPTQVIIVDSGLESSSTTLRCRQSSTQDFVPISGVTLGTAYSIPSGGCASSSSITPGTTTPTNADNSLLYATSPWIRSNTARDLPYMYRILALSGTTMGATLSGRIHAEMTMTEPTSAEQTTLCGTSGTQRWWNAQYGCQDYKLLAIADYTIPSITGSLSQSPIAYLSGSEVLFVSPSSTIPSITIGVGVGILSPGQVIKYTDSSLLGMLNMIGGFSGKILEIETQNIGNTSNGLILQFGDTHYLKYTFNTLSCSSAYCILLPSADGKHTIRINVGTTGDLYMGSNGSTNMIYGYIKKIRVLQE